MRKKRSPTRKRASQAGSGARRVATRAFTSDTFSRTYWTPVPQSGWTHELFEHELELPTAVPSTSEVKYETRISGVR
jgi:hypothetical protein